MASSVETLSGRDYESGGPTLLFRVKKFSPRRTGGPSVEDPPPGRARPDRGLGLRGGDLGEEVRAGRRGRELGGPVGADARPVR